MRLFQEHHSKLIAIFNKNKIEAIASSPLKCIITRTCFLDNWSATKPSNVPIQGAKLRITFQAVSKFEIGAAYCSVCRERNLRCTAKHSARSFSSCNARHRAVEPHLVTGMQLFSTSSHLYRYNLSSIHGNDYVSVLRFFRVQSLPHPSSPMTSVDDTLIVGHF